MRTADIKRTTGETSVQLTLNLDGTGSYDVETGCGFLNHMLELFSRHAMVDLTVRCAGDTHVDDHHTVEDVGICLGQALKQAAGDKRGIVRYGQWLLPMDEALVLCALDLSGRGWLGWRMELPSGKVGTFDVELAREFFQAVAREAGMTLHFKQLSGFNTHHMLEAAFKGCGRALRQAVSRDERLGDSIPSTKGSL